MKASELRIGNWVNCECLDFENECIQLENIHPKGTTVDGYPYSIKELKPIPLTEEWLLKFGFEKTLNQYKKLTLSNKIGCDNIPFIILFLDNQYQYDDLRFRTNIQYVNRLQNLYFALTGEELTIKD